MRKLITATDKQIEGLMLILSAAYEELDNYEDDDDEGRALKKAIITWHRIIAEVKRGL